MKIVHIAPKAPYNDNWGYQDNLLPKYHKKAGHEVTVLISTFTHKDGKIVETAPADYFLPDGVRVVRLARKKYPHRVMTSQCCKMDVYPYLEEIRPDFVFYHSLNGTTIYDVIRYKRNINPDCIIVRDNHLDYNNVRETGLKKILIRSFDRFHIRKTMPYVSRVYGVTPWRKQYAEAYFRVPQSKTDVLIMGADDEEMSLVDKAQIRYQVRKQYAVSDADFLVVTGGKIDSEKKIHMLMKACMEIEGVKLLIFGNVCDDIRDEFERLLSECDRLIYIGWINAGDVYRYFFASDLVCFPGGHSVMWEQACASKVPCLFRKWDGMEHVNNGGNSDFLDHVTVASIKEKIYSLQFTPAYDIMKQVAESNATDIYRYSFIAKKSLECIKQT